MSLYEEESSSTATKTTNNVTMETKAATTKSGSSAISSSPNVTKTPTPIQDDLFRSRQLKTDLEDIWYVRHCYYLLCYFLSCRYCYLKMKNFRSCNLGLHILEIIRLDLIQSLLCAVMQISFVSKIISALDVIWSSDNSRMVFMSVKLG